MHNIKEQKDRNALLQVKGIHAALFHMSRVDSLEHALRALHKLASRLIMILLQILQAPQKLVGLDGLNLSHPSLPWNICGPARPDLSLSPRPAHMDPDTARPARPSHGPAFPPARPFPLLGPSHGPALHTARPGSTFSLYRATGLAHPGPISAWLAGQGSYFPARCPHVSASATTRARPGSTRLHLAHALGARITHPASRAVAALQHFGP